MDEPTRVRTDVGTFTCHIKQHLLRRNTQSTQITRSPVKKRTA